MTTLDKLRHIKLLRLKPEERFLTELVSKTTIRTSDDYDNVTFYTIKNKIIFEENTINKTIHCHHGKVWQILVSKYSLSYNKIQKLFENIDYFKPKTDYRFYTISLDNKGIWDSIKLKKLK